MKKFLSIDWDYFIDTDIHSRLRLFPDGGNEDLDPFLQKFVWDKHYSYSPELEKIGVLKPAVNLVREVLDKFCNKCLSHPRGGSKGRFLATISHRDIYKYIMSNTTEDEVFEVYNVDFHHDMYCYRVPGRAVNCGNWVNILKESRPNMIYHWVKREDSETEVIDGSTVNCSILPLESIKEVDFSHTFICRSDCWSPPHLDPEFNLLWETPLKSIHVVCDKGVMQHREVDVDPCIRQKIENHRYN